MKTFQFQIKLIVVPITYMQFRLEERYKGCCYSDNEQALNGWPDETFLCHRLYTIPSQWKTKRE